MKMNRRALFGGLFSVLATGLVPRLGNSATYFPLWWNAPPGAGIQCRCVATPAATFTETLGRDRMVTTLKHPQVAELGVSISPRVLRIMDKGRVVCAQVEVKFLAAKIPWVR